MVRPSPPKPPLPFQPRLQLSLLSHAYYKENNPTLAFFLLLYLFRKLFSSLQHHSICISASPRAASFKQLYRTRPAQLPEPTCPLTMGRIRYSTSVSGLATIREFWSLSCSSRVPRHPRCHSKSGDRGTGVVRGHESKWTTYFRGLGKPVVAPRVASQSKMHTRRRQ